MVYINAILRLDTWLFKNINNNLKRPYLDKIMPLFTSLGGFRMCVVSCLGLIFLSLRVNGLGKSAVISLISSHLVVQLIKNFVSRQRPYLVIDEVNLKDGFILEDFSFPSGHTTAGFALATVTAAYFPATAPLIMLVAVLIGVSRIYLGMHYPSDVLIGAIIGVVSGILSI